MNRRILSAILALVFAVSVFAPSFTVLADNGCPYIESLPSGAPVYHRLVNGEDTAFYTDYDEMIYQIRSQLISRSTDIEYRFATTDEEFAYSALDESDKALAQAATDKLYGKMFDDIFEIGSDTVTLGGGEYLFNSIKNITLSSTGLLNIGTTGRGYFNSEYDTPIDGTRYYTFVFSFRNIQYDSTPEQERMVRYFTDWFNCNYIGADYTEYQKVKTIYDFIVRNTDYDWETFNSKVTGSTTTVTPERYDIAHSAYGALYGGILNESESGVVNSISETFAHKLTVTDELVPVNYNQGLAVCEGYSKLFYYLCTANGIRCHIVDGDYIEESGKDNDPHEWNYVYLDDAGADGYKWFQVDCTAAAQSSIKQIDVNNYDYFLCGKDSVHFGWRNHQQAYENKGYGIKWQLYDWYDNVNESSQKDYVFDKVHMNAEHLSDGYIICRTTVYEDGAGERKMHILCDKNGYEIIEVNEEGLTLTDVEGFVYTGYNSEFSVMLPYVVNRLNILDNGDVSEGEYTVSEQEPITNAKNGNKSKTAKTAGSYYITVIGADGTTMDIPFVISARDMSEDAIRDDSVVLAFDYANYTGSAIVPQITITDPFRNNLVENKDYTVSFQKDNQTVSQIKDIGEYKIVINYRGNYRGTYYLDFTMDGVDLAQLSTDKRVYQYMPKYYRSQTGITNPADYFEKMTTSGLTVGSTKLYAGKDYSISSSGTSLDYGSKGNIVLTGLAGSNVKAGTKMSIPYEVSKKYNISDFDGKNADTNTVNKVYYTGSAVKPTKFDYLDTYLEQGKDYKITGYVNNTDVGYAYVKIQGIGGCEGTATLRFYINPSPQPTNLVKPTSSANVIKLARTTYIYNGKVNKPKVTFRNGNGKAIDPYYYTVSYTGGKNVGTAYAVIKLRGGYSGTFKTAYTIKPKATSMKSISAGKKCVTVKWNKQTAQTTGYQLQYGTASNYKGAKTVTIGKNTTVSKKITKLKSKKICYVRVRTYRTVGGKKYYSSWSKGLGIKVK